MSRLATLLASVVVIGIVVAVAAGATLFVNTGGVKSSLSQNGGAPGTATTSTGSIETVSSSATTNTTTVTNPQEGTLVVHIVIGPTEPVCFVNATASPAPHGFDSIKAVITDSSGRVMTYGVSWISHQCYVEGFLTSDMGQGTYSLSLSTCSYMGCKNSLPRNFTIMAGETTGLDVSIFTGIV